MRGSPATLFSCRRSRTCLGWIEWITGWIYIICEILFQRISASYMLPFSLLSMQNRTCIVTGCTSGIGLEIARQLAEKGAHVVMAVRNKEAAYALILKWQKEWQTKQQGEEPSLNIEVMELDLLSLCSVVAFAKSWNARCKPLHALVNNAGIFSIGEPQRFSNNGYEQHMQVNHLAPALLSILLLPSLIRGTPGRIVNMNSLLHYVGFVDSEDMNLTSGKRKYSSLVAYSSSKLAQVKFSSVLQKKLPISVVCVSPGVVRTNVARDLPKFFQSTYHAMPFFFFDPQEGCRSALFAVADDSIPDRCAGLRSKSEPPACAFISHCCKFVAPSHEALSEHSSQLVWEKTLQMIGLPPNAPSLLMEEHQQIEVKIPNLC